MRRLRVAQAGCGVRGQVHIKGFQGNEDIFEYVGICDLDEKKAKRAAHTYSIHAPIYTDTEKMLAETKPDVFCFVTPPSVRLSLVELGVKYGVKGLLMEKPMALSLKEARKIKNLCDGNRVKAAVCHQHKYLPSMQKLKSYIDSGELGEIKKIHVNTRPWMAELGTHFMDYALWAADGSKAKWVTGHVNGRQKLNNSHPSPDFSTAVILLENNVRIYFETGYLSEQNLSDELFWLDDRITVYGTDGYVWAESNGSWQAVTAESGKKTGHMAGFIEYMDKMQKLYIRDIAKWIFDKNKVHPCNIDISCHGYELMEAVYLSALNNIRVDIPIKNIEYGDFIERLKKSLPQTDTYIPNLSLNY